MTISRESSQGEGSGGRGLAGAPRSEESWVAQVVWPLEDVVARVRAQRWGPANAWCLSVDVRDGPGGQLVASVVRHHRGDWTEEDACSWLFETAHALLASFLNPDPF